ncbi:PREDICTED: purple acid phosphatase 22-like [Camelina sativa]|uniref:Purple acid phosphatase n=1 Tax=Camelina sativa TaxID=90675 RepID=A0ABM0TIG6_CAMSA|nr:PREDICTED: purple acid phosphatase 22-like [Camelina sativa]
MKMKLLGLFLCVTLLFLCPFISQADDDSKSDPQQVHVSLAGKDYMRVTFITEDEKVDSVVEYGKQPGKYDGKATGESTSYGYLFYNSGKIHHVKIGPLQSNTIYYYRCGGNGPEFSFKTPPSTFPVEFAIVGDLGQTESTDATLSQIKSQDYDVFLLPGDLSYAGNRYYSRQSLWDSFGSLVEPLASKRPWMVTEGNHEKEVYLGFTSYNARWKMPYAESLSDSNLYYSFDVAGVHTVMLGSYTKFDSDSDQYQWLEANLAKVDRKTTPWVIVLMHAPWYNTNEAHKGEGESMREAMESLLYSARVDVVFSGHVHGYERFKRVYNNKADSCGPIYITIGGGGRSLAPPYKKHHSKLSEYRESSFGHGRLKVIDGKRAHWSWHRNTDSNSRPGDEIWLDSLSTSSPCWPSSHSKDEL